MENNRINYVEIAGTKYPLTFSLLAAKTIAREYGSLEGMFNTLKNSEDTLKQLDAVIFVLETLIKQGCAYLNVFEKNIPHDTEGTCYDGDKYVAPATETLELGIDIGDLGDIVQVLSKTISKSSKKTIEVESNGEEKNAESPVMETPISGLTYGEEN